MKNNVNKRNLEIKTLLVFLITFVLAAGLTDYQNQTQEKEEKSKAAYTAESTITHIEAQLNKYLAESNLIKQIVESGRDIDTQQFATISELMQDKQHVIKAHELAPNGVISYVYPLESNEAAIGLDMLENKERKKEANLAKETGEYTIAGPYELVQGGTGSLLFDPIYTNDTTGGKNFWGFSILVIDWNQFMEEIQLNKLENAGYEYQIWKENTNTGEKIVIAQSQSYFPTDTLEVACAVPNDTWYFEIVPKEGWTTIHQVVLGLFFALIIASLLAIGYWQASMRRLKDILHAEEMEKTAQKAEAANESKTRFLFNMSHDISTPMNAIIGFSELLEKHIDEKDKVTYYIGKIKSSSSLLLSLINYVLEMARIESGKADLRLDTGHFQELRDSLQTVFEPALKEKGLTYSTHLDIQHPYIIYDKTKTSEILLNIVGNSIKYTPRGGHIRLDISEIPSERSDVATYRMIIEDTGIGMSEEYLPHICEEFTREHTSTENKIAGTGLGLPIVKSLVDLMGGTIQIESKVNEGTETTIQIPFLIATQEQIEESQTYSPNIVTNHALGKRILIAEDNKLNAEIAETILQENGYEVDCVEDGCQCLVLLQEKPEDYYGLILMDIQMPNLNGYETTRLIRNLKNQRATIPIIAMTANAFDEDKKKAFAAGMNAHIAKPIDVEVLLHTLEKFIQ